MYVRNRMLVLIYRIFLVLICGYGLFLYWNPFSGGRDAGMFRYYTIQSNMLCFLFFACLCIFSRKKGEGSGGTFLLRFKGAVTMAITVTMLIYQFMLADTPFRMGAGDGVLRSFIVHFIVPVMVIADWLLFDPKGGFRKIDPLLWLGIPLLYFFYVLIAAQLGADYGGSRYPYWFIDADRLGWGKMMLYVAALFVGFLGLGYIYYGVDRLMAGKRGSAAGV